MIEFDILSIVLTGIGIIIALTYYALQIRTQNKTRQAQLIMQVYNHFVSKPFLEAKSELMFRWSKEEFNTWEETMNKLGPDVDRELWNKYDQLCHHMGGLGVLVKNKLLDPVLIDDFYSGLIITYWETFGPAYIDYRVKMNYPHAMEMAEFLYNEVKRIMLEQHPELETVKLTG